MLTYAQQKRPEKIERHYTPPALARRLLSLVPVVAHDCAIDPSAGATRPFLRAFPTRKKLYCEIAEGSDFLAETYGYDWAITNPPYHLLWQFIDKASLEARKSFAFLVNINGINTLTPKRLELLRQRGWHLRRLHVCQIRQWFGRYYFYVFLNQRGACALSWDQQVW